ncbi:TonB-dependent receptor [Sphingomonas adhaesiva]|uniref:TonB-dependent receptor n=1 Tax=Sphingomonas adhaesiva TaxID=28212 RepID=UPI002FF964A8
MKGTTVSLLTLAVVLASGLGSGLGATPAWAQDAANANDAGTTAQDQPATPSSPGASSNVDPRRPAQAPSDSGIADIVVTAQKREQNLQDVPVVVSVLNQAQLESAGVRDIKDLQTITPGLNVTSSTSQAQTSIRIRGIGTVGDNPGLESSVGTIIDGVYRARSSVAFGDLGDLQRVEVLKGPQSTLFGKNMSAGVINVVTAAPSFTPKAEFIASYGNYNAWTVSGSATTGIVDDRLAVSVFGLKRERDGIMTVRTGGGPRTNTRDADVDNYALRGQILARPIDGLDIRIIGDYSKRDENCCVNTVLIAGPTRAFVDALSPDEGLLQNGRPYTRIAYANRDTPNVITDWGVSGQLDYDLGGDFSATSITAWRYYKGAFGSDIDYSSADIWYRPIEQNQNTFNVFSQEARLAYNGERLKSIVGAFYSNERLFSEAGTRFGRDYENYFGLLLSAGANRNTVSALTGLPAGQNFIPDSGAYDRHFHKAVSFAAFTENTLTLTDGLDVTLGLRYSDEVKNVTSIFSNLTPGNACRAALSRPIPAAARTALCAPTADFAFDNVTTQQRRTERRFNGSAKVQYRFSPQVMVYGSYANGFKSGGMNLDRARFSPGVINPDTQFDTEKVDAYEIGTKTTLFDRRVLANLAGFYQRYTGFQLNTYTGISFLVASIPVVTSKGVDFDFLWNTGVQGLTLNAGATYADTKFGNFTPPAGISARLPDNTLPYAAKWNVTGGFTSTQPVGAGLELTSSASVKWTSSYNTGSNLDPLKIQQPFALVNARLGIGPESKAWSLEVWGQNLTNAEFTQVVVDQPLQSGTYGTFLGPPRTYGVTGRVRF